jgi:hypothetical protein
VTTDLECLARLLAVGLWLYLVAWCLMRLCVKWWERGL